MNLELLDNLDSETWERALATLPDGAELLQSLIWKNIALAEGRNVRQFAWQEQGIIVALAQILETGRAGLKGWYLPRGPICLNPKRAADIWPFILKDLQIRAKTAGVAFIRFEPENWPLPVEAFGQKIKAIQPARSLFLNLSQTDQELLTEMHPKTRYNIRVAEKKGVEIFRGCKGELLLFWRLLQTTTARDHFSGHNLKHYQRLQEQGKPAIELWLARREGKILAAGLFSFYQGRAVYLHGASANEGRQYMAPHLLQWRMIERAREQGCRYYDFYGIDEEKWPGVTRFKKGFGGEERVYPGTFLLVVSRWPYFLYKIWSQLARWLRRF